MKYLIILAFFVGASFACRTFRQSCSHYPIDNEECCQGWECRVPNDEERREGDGQNTRCMNITSTTTTSSTTTQATTTEQSCRTLYQSCSDADQVSEDSCCSRYKCRMPRDGERGDGQGNTRCFYPDNDGGNEETTEATTTTTEATTTTTEATCSQTNEECVDHDNCCSPDDFCEDELINGTISTGRTTCQPEATTTTTEEPRCRVETETCDLDTPDCCNGLTCEETGTSFLTGEGTCQAPTQSTTTSTTTTTTTTQAPCRRQNEDCNLLTNDDCCQGLECRGNGTSLVTGTCQAPTQSTTTSTTARTTTTRAPAECKRREQRCNNSDRQCCSSSQGDNEDLVCKRKDGERRSKCHLRSEPECQTRGQECRSEGDCCQYRDEERKICYRERRGRRGTCDVCRQTEEECRYDSDCCSVEGEEVTCVRERRRGNGKCQIQSTTTTTTTERASTSRRTRSTTQRSTRQTTERRTRSTTASTTTAAPECKRENEQCQNTTECCQERDNELVCQAGIFGPLAPSTCQRQTATTERSTTTTTEGSSSTTEQGTLLPTGCSQRGGPCPQKTDDECCEDLKCVSIDGMTYQCGYRGVNGTAIA